MNARRCPGCGSSKIRDLGAIPRNNLFAGRVVPPMPARLAVCQRCHLGFRSPQPSREKLGQLYKDGAGSAWHIDDQPRPDWRLAADLIAEIGARTVLDVGCFDGSFFDLLEPKIEPFGIEINPAAAKRAHARGVNVIAQDLHQLRALGTVVDCVVAFDVIEHVHNPAEFLSALLHVVRPGGHVIFATGDFSAPAQRLMGSNYLYSWYQEHIAFVSPRWTRAQASTLGVDVVTLTRFSHHPQGRRGFLAGLAKNTSYRLAPGLVNWRRRSRLAGNTPLADGPSFGPPVWTSAKDHFLVMLRKPA